MKWTVFIRPRANEDIQEARDWYNQRQTNLGNSFLDQVSRAVQVLENDADRFPVYYRGFRRILLPRIRSGNIVIACPLPKNQASS